MHAKLCFKKKSKNPTTSKAKRFTDVIAKRSEHSLLLLPRGDVFCSSAQSLYSHTNVLGKCELILCVLVINKSTMSFHSVPLYVSVTGLDLNFLNSTLFSFM